MNKKVKETLIKVGLIAIVALFIAVLLTKRFIYFHASSDFLETRETYKIIRQGHLHGWMIEGPPGSKVVLFCHGARGNMSHYETQLTALHQLGYSVVAFDYSGFGKSTGIPSEQQLYDDASGIIALLRQNYEPNDMILYGKGIGAPVATYVARRYRIPTIILESPLPTARTIVKNTPLRYFGFLFSEFDTSAYLNGYRGRSLLIHSVTDEIISADETLELQQMVTSYLPTSGSHSATQVPWDDVKRFIDKST